MKETSPIAIAKAFQGPDIDYSASRRYVIRRRSTIKAVGERT